MIENTDAFIALRGRPGTLKFQNCILGIDEHPPKTIEVLDVNHYYDLLMMFLDNAVRHDFLLS